MGDPQAVQTVDPGGYSITYLGGGKMACCENGKVNIFRLPESKEQKDLREANEEVEEYLRMYSTLTNTKK